MNSIESHLLRGMTQLTMMNSRMIGQLYDLHYGLVEKVVALHPNEPGVLAALSSAEQIKAAVVELESFVKEMQKVSGL